MNTIKERISVVETLVTEIKENHLVHLDAKIDKVDSKVDKVLDKTDKQTWLLITTLASFILGLVYIILR